jgi:hypothetical protein
MRRAPVHLDHPTVGAAVDADPIAGPVGTAETEDDAGKDVSKTALQRETENDGDNAGRCQCLVSTNRTRGDDREQRSKIDQTGKQILRQLALAAGARRSQKGPQKADREPRRPQPPRDLQNRMGGIVPQDPGRLQRLAGRCPRTTARRQQDQKADPHDRPRHRRCETEDDAAVPAANRTTMISLRRERS